MNNPDETKWGLNDAYKSAYYLAKAASHLPVTLSPELDAKIKAHVEKGEIKEAQRLILDELNAQFDAD